MLSIILNDSTYNDEGDIYYEKYYLPDIYDDGTRVNGTHREVFQDNIVFLNSKKVLDAFQKNSVSEYHFNSTTGYGYNDLGRDVIESVYSDIFKS